VFKKLLLILFIGSSAFSVNAQFSKATLQATGLTCAMCSNAVNKALQKVSFVESVRSDIKNSAFNIVFKKSDNVDIDALKEAVEDAGFSVGSLKLTGTFNDVKVEKDEHIRLGTNNFHFVDTDDRILNGEQTVTIVDKNFVTAKTFKRISASTKMECVREGKTAACCVKEGMNEGERVYHVML
jgi:copper chaperone CopZ